MAAILKSNLSLKKHFVMLRLVITRILSLRPTSFTAWQVTEVWCEVDIVIPCHSFSLLRRIERFVQVVSRFHSVMRSALNCVLWWTLLCFCGEHWWIAWWTYCSLCDGVFNSNGEESRNTEQNNIFVLSQIWFFRDCMRCSLSRCFWFCIFPDRYSWFIIYW